jgi:hypothetical protein
MELSKKTIRLFLDLQEIINPETSKILQPIIAEVERQRQKVLLSPPVVSTTWVEWQFKKPQDDVFKCYHYIFLLIQPGQAADDLDLCLIARLGGLPNAVEREVIKEHYRTGRRRTAWVGDMPEWLDEEEESEEGLYDLVYSNEELGELERFSLKGEIKPEVVAARIVAHAKEIYKLIALNAKARRKERARKRARDRQRQALVQNTPIPTN